VISYDTPIDAYHASKALTHSKLRDYSSKGARYFASRHVTRTTPPSESTEAQVMGQLFEDIVQGRSFDRDAYAVKPDDMTFATKIGKAWKAEQLAAGKRIVTGDDLADMEEMRVALEENDAAVQLIRGCHKQVTLTVDCAGTPEGLAARPDWVSFDGCALSGFSAYSLDLKTTIALRKLTNGRGVLEWGYHSQAALVRHLMRAHGRTDTVHFLLACEKKRPYRCQVIAIPPAWLDLGWQWCERQLSKLTKHYASGSWPRVDSEIVELPPPPTWAAEDVQDEDEAA
jgi:hypothetical protein